MPLKIAVQMDPIEGVDIDADSSFDVALEGQARGHEIWVYEPRALSFRDKAVTAEARQVRLKREPGAHVETVKAERLDLRAVDVVLMRQDPPFDMAYITATHILEHIHPETLVVNAPASVRNAPEKLFVTHFDGLCRRR